MPRLVVLVVVRAVGKQPIAGPGHAAGERAVAIAVPRPRAPAITAVSAISGRGGELPIVIVGVAEILARADDVRQRRHPRIVVVAQRELLEIAGAAAGSRATPGSRPAAAAVAGPRQRGEPAGVVVRKIPLAGRRRGVLVIDERRQAAVGVPGQRGLLVADRVMPGRARRGLDDGGRAVQAVIGVAVLEVVFQPRPPIDLRVERRPVAVQIVLRVQLHVGHAGRPARRAAVVVHARDPAHFVGGERVAGVLATVPRGRVSLGGRVENARRIVAVGDRVRVVVRAEGAGAVEPPLERRAIEKIVPEGRHPAVGIDRLGEIAAEIMSIISRGAGY